MTIRWGREYTCLDCGARVMRMFDSPRGRLMDNDPTSRMGPHNCPAEEAERRAWWDEWFKSNQGGPSDAPVQTESAPPAPTPAPTSGRRGARIPTL